MRRSCYGKGISATGGGAGKARVLATIAGRRVVQVEWLLGLPVSETVSTIDVRQRIGDLLNRVALRHDEFVIARKGKPLAALVPVERLEQMRRFARRHALDTLAAQRGGSLSDAAADTLAREAQAWARTPRRRAKRRTK